MRAAGLRSTYAAVLRRRRKIMLFARATLRLAICFVIIPAGITLASDIGQEIGYCPGARTG